MTAHGIPAVNRPKKVSENVKKSHAGDPALGLMIPDRTNMGTARSGKLSSPAEHGRIRYLAPTVKDGSKMCGSTAVIPKGNPHRYY